jgi:hypothetical protein
MSEFYFILFYFVMVVIIYEKKNKLVKLLVNKLENIRQENKLKLEHLYLIKFICSYSLL